MCINCNYKDQKNFVDQSEYYMFKLNNKQCDSNFCQKYQQIVGSLMYLVIGLCSDIGFAVVKLAQQIENPSNEHYQAGLHLCRYLLNTCKYQIVYDGLVNESIVTHFDSDWTQDPELYKSITGYFTLIAREVTS